MSMSKAEAQAKLKTMDWMVHYQPNEAGGVIKVHLDRRLMDLHPNSDDWGWLAIAAHKAAVVQNMSDGEYENLISHPLKQRYVCIVLNGEIYASLTFVAFPELEAVAAELDKQ
jgi:hypothetical protein